MSAAPVERTPLAAPWAHHLVAHATSPVPGEMTLSPTEAARVQRHHDRLMAAWRAQDRLALHHAKQEVLDGAFSTVVAEVPPAFSPARAVAPSPALRRALRDLSWRMAGLLLPRGLRQEHWRK